jgi:hypothetical protein
MLAAAVELNLGGNHTYKYEKWQNNNIFSAGNSILSGKDKNIPAANFTNFSPIVDSEEKHCLDQQSWRERWEQRGSQPLLVGGQDEKSVAVAATTVRVPAADIDPATG